MDSDNNFSHERLHDDMLYSGKGWNSLRPKSTLITYATSGTSHSASIVDLNELRSNVAGLALKLHKMENASKKASCESGWSTIGNNCYYFSSTKSNWMKARAMCMKKNSDLVVINNKEEQDFISGRTSSMRYWIGLSDLDDEGVWTWVDGTDYEKSFKFWKKGEPNDYSSNEDCAHVWTSGEWNDVHCTYDQAYAVCEMKLS
ncbi:hepatic lectin isoform X2 [Bombina bombina]|uniref:hepatic lectin isoform X2 n=1 Tax=Bombina bombina TaxID=8345 RepID=UPI00235B00C6|nr:hepatic lectin isoform X2 [Bombina bombina]